MATITLKGNNINTVGNLPKTGENAHDFTLVNTEQVLEIVDEPNYEKALKAV